MTVPETGGGTISYAVKAGSEGYIDVNASTGALTIKAVPPTDGKAYVTVTAVETDTYAQTTKDVTVTISKAASVPATVVANSRPYDRTEQPLVTVDSTTLVGGEMVYAIGTDAITPPEAAAYTAAIPMGTDAGTYYVWCYVKGDANHLDSTVACIIVTIVGQDQQEPERPKPSGRVLPKLEPKGDNALKLSWTKMNNVDGYDIFFIDCHSTFKSTPTASVGADVSEYVFKGLKKKSMHKACVLAYVMENGAKSYVSERMDVHSIVGGSADDWTIPAKVKVKDLTLAVGTKQKINPTVIGKDKGKKVLAHNDGKLFYISLDPSVATVSEDGTVRAVKEGSAKVLVIACNGEKATMKVTVGQGPDKLSFGKKKYTVKAGKTIDLYKLLKISPKNAIVSLKWTSSDKKTATVDENGVVTGVQKGTVTVTVTDTASGVKTTVKIQVKKGKK